MMYSNPGFAMGTSIGATLETVASGSGITDHNRYQYTMEDNGYFLITQARTIPNGETDPQLPTPTGFTKLNERVIVNGSEYSGYKTTALGVYIKQCSQGEVISASLAPDSRITLDPVEVVSSVYPNRYTQLQDLIFNYITDTNAARNSLGISESNVYGFDIEFRADYQNDSTHGVILAGHADGFRMLRSGAQLTLFVRNTLVYQDDVLNMYEWNTVSLKNNTLTVNGVDVHTIDTSLAVGTNSTTIYVFGYGAGVSDWRYTAGVGAVRKVVLYRANDSYTYYPTVDTRYNNSYGMFNVSTGNFYSTEVSYTAFTTGYNYQQQDYPLSTSGPINQGVYGDIIGVPIYGAQRYEYSTDWNDLGVYTKDGRYASIYFALSNPTSGNIVKDGNNYCYFTRPPKVDSTNNWYNGEGATGLIGGFSPDMASGVNFFKDVYSNYTSDGITTFEVRFFDENSKQDETFGTIIRNGIRYTPDIKKIIPTYNGTFINDFKVLHNYDYKFEGETIHDSIESIKFIVPSAVSNVSSYPYTTLQFKYINMQFCSSTWNIFSDQLGSISPLDYHNIVLGGRLVANTNYNHSTSIAKPITGTTDGQNYSSSYGNVILGEHNYGYTSSTYFGGRIIIGRNNKSYTSSGDTHWIIGESNDIISQDYLFCGGYGNKVHLRYDYPGTSILGAYNVLIESSSDAGAYAPFVAGAHNSLQTHYGSQNIIGYENSVYDNKDVSYSYNVNGNTYSGSYDDDIGRYGVFVSGRLNNVYGGTTACIGFSNAINDDIGYNDTTTVLDSNKNGMVYASRGVIGSQNTVAGVLFTAGANNLAQAISTVLGERNRCNQVETYGTYVTPGVVVNTDYLIRRGQILGSFNQVNGSGTIVGFANRANRVKAIFGSDNYVDLDTQPAVSGMIFGDANSIVTAFNSYVYGSNNSVTSAGDVVFGNNNTTNSNGGQIYGSYNTVSYGSSTFGYHNTVSSGSFSIGYYNTVNSGSIIIGTNNTMNGGGGYNVLGSSNAINGGYGYVIGSGNTIDNLNGSIGLVGNYNIAKDGATIFGSKNDVRGGSTAFGINNTINYGTSAVGINNTVTGGGGHYIIGIGNTATNASAQIIGLSNNISAGLAIGKYLSNTDTNTYRITIGAYNDSNVDFGVRVVFGDGSGSNDRHNLFYSTAEHDTYFSGHVYSTNVPDAPDTTGVYMLQCTVTNDGTNVVKTYEWINSNN